MPSVQFRGKDAVLEAYRNQDIDAWAIFDGKRLMVKNIGEEFLREYLNILEESGLNAAYTLKVYEDVKDRKLIKEKTDCDGSFNFTVFTLDEYHQKPQYQEYVQRRSTLTDEIKLLREEVAQLKTADEPEPKNRLGFIGELIESPIGDAIMPHLGTIIASWFTKGNPQMQLPAAVGNLQTPQQKSTAGSIVSFDVTAAEDLLPVVTELLQSDPRLKEHLEKLLNVAKSDPTSFKFFIAALDKM